MTLGIIAGCISATAFFPYLVSILKRKTKPNRATWWIWSWLGVLLYFSYKASGANDTLWVPLIYAILPGVIALLSIKYGAGGWTKFDLSCLIASLAGTVLWFVSGNPVIAMFLFLLIDFSGILPTIRKTYLHPGQEDSLAWLLMAVANLINIFAVEKIQFSIIIYPLYLFLSGSVILILSLRKD